MKRFLQRRPQLVDLALAIGFFVGFFGLLYELGHETRIAYGVVWICLMAASGITQWVLNVRAMVKNPEGFGGGLI